MRLTLPQQDVYFEQLLFTHDPIYNIGAKISIRGPFSRLVANTAYQVLINQHDAYRLQINEKGEIQLGKEFGGNLQFLDFSAEPRADSLALDFMDQAFRVPFDFSHSNLLHRFILIKVAPEFHYLFSVYHHIITDGWGTSLMFQRLVKNYNELLVHHQVQTEYPFSYQDFVDDDLKYRESSEFEADKAYWKQRFASPPDNILPRKRVYQPKSSRKELILERSFYNKLSSLAKEQGGSTFHLILATLYTYFSRINHSTNFAIGLPVLNRSTAAFKKTVGLFMGVSPLLVPFTLQDTFGELIRKIRTQLRADYRHQRFPLGKIISELGLAAQESQLFDISLSYEKQNYSDHFVNTKTSVIPLTHQAERVGLALYIREFDDDEAVKIDFDYNHSFFDERSIEVVVDHIYRLLEELVSKGSKKLSGYNFLNPDEELELLQKFNNTKLSYSAADTVVSLFEKAVNSFPDSIAVQDGSLALSYRDLHQRSNKIAQFLIENSTASNCQPVAVLMPRSVNLLAALLGVLKSGRAYIPLDPEFPTDRLRYIIKHSEVDYVISEQDTPLGMPGLEVIPINSIIESSQLKGEVWNSQPQSSSVAYILYTSGSTGNPKGVAVTHASLANFLRSMQLLPGIQPTDTLFSVTTQSFDISGLEFYLPLISGARVHMCPADVLQDPTAIIKSLKQVNPTIMQATPSFYQMLINAGWRGNPALTLLCGGDTVNADLIQLLLNSCGALWNMYGPTETTIWSSIKQLTKPAEAGNIGKPIHNTQFYVLDATMNLLPKGSSGDIWIGGLGLAQGYYLNPELTDRVFKENPFCKGAKIYKTGDVGRWNTRGELEFLGRSDNQIKVRGYRIEPGEIEATLNQHPLVEASVIIAHEQATQSSILVAFICLKANIQGFCESSLISHLRKSLPEYMVPHKIVVLDQIPLTPNKKVDRKLLSTQLNALAGGKQAEVVPPTTETEAMLCGCFKDLLQLTEAVGANSHFFALGGHSLSAVKLLGKIEEQTGFHLTLKDVFEKPIITDLAKYLESGRAVKAPVSIPLTQLDFYPVTQPQYAIWLAGLQGEKSVAYNMFMAFEVHGELDHQCLQTVFNHVIEKHEALRTNFVEHQGYPHQKISPTAGSAFKLDLINVDEEYLEVSLEKYVNQKFELDRDLLLRVGLFNRSDGQNILAFVTHHIIMDGWSLEVLIQEVISRYQGEISGQSYYDQQLRFQFKDYSVWYEKLENSTRVKNTEFWQTYLSNYSWKNLVPYDRSMAVVDNGGTYHHFNWEMEFLNSVEALATRLKVTLHNLLVGAFYATLHSCYGLTDICVGTINSGRPLAELHNQMGMFVKTLPLRIQVDPSLQFSEFIHSLQENMLIIDNHQDIPREVFSKIRLEAILVLQNQTFDYENIPINQDLRLAHFPVNPHYNRLPLLLNFTKTQGGMHGSVHYDTGKYQPESLQLLSLRLEKLLQEVLISSDIQLGELNIVLPFEEEDLEINFNF